MKQAQTTKRNFRKDLAVASAAALLALGTALASPQYVSLTVQGPVDTRTGTRAADETEPILLSARLPGAGQSELWIDGVGQGRVDDVWPDGRIVDNTFEWPYPEYGEEDSDSVHVMTLQRDGEDLYTAYFGGPLIEKQSLNGISMGWLVHWKDFVAEHYLGDYMKASEGFTVSGVPMYNAYVAAMDPTDPNARISFTAERLAEDENRIRFSVAGSHPTEAIGPRRYVLQATDSLMPDGSGTAPVWRDVGELPNGTLDLPDEDVRALGRFLRVAVRLPQTSSDGALARSAKSKPVARSASLSLGAETRGFTSDAANSKELSVTANVAWTAKSSASWLTVKTASGSGNGKIVYNVAANTGNVARTAKITVSGGGLTRTFTVLQNGKEGAVYMVVDLSGGSSAAWYPVSYFDGPPSDGWTDEYKTTKLVLGRMGGLWYTMGSPTNETGRSANETPHYVKHSKLSYIGVFEVTQKQWTQVMGAGSNPSGFVGDKLPVEKVSWNTIRDNTGWPASPGVSASSFMGRLRARTGLADFDLPTEAQWEYACRALTPSAYSYGGSADGNYMWYASNSSSKTHEVGTKEPNIWGFYDMHGNVWEWCLDWYGAYGTADETDPKGPSSGEYRILRGGSWNSGASSCRAAYRGYESPSKAGNSQGFRVAKFSDAVIGGGGGGLILGSGSRSFTANAANGKELSLTATMSWTAKSSASWLKVRTASGSGDGTILYDVAANTGTSERTATISVSGGGNTVIFVVTQSGKSGGGGGSATLTLSSSSRSFTADAASSKELSVTATVSWTAKSSASWLTVKTASGSGNGKIVYNVAANSGTASRTATITVSGGGKTATFTVTQSGKSGGGSATLTLGSTSRTFTADAANNKELSVTATVSWTAKSSASWLTVKTASGSGNGKIVYNVAANTGSASRTATITVSGGGKSATFTVTQSGKAGGVQLWKKGPYWAETNIGADKPEDAGLYFWWGDTVGYKRKNGAWAASDGSVADFEFSEKNTPTYDKDIATLESKGWITAEGVLAPKHDAAQAHWGGTWRMPTDAEFSALVDNCDQTWTTRNGVAGYEVRGRGDYAGSSIFLPAAGYGDGTSLYGSGSSGYYWSSTPNSSYSGRVWRLYFNSGSFRRYYSYRDFGHPVRAVR